MLTGGGAARLLRSGPDDAYWKSMPSLQTLLLLNNTGKVLPVIHVAWSAGAAMRPTEVTAAAASSAFIRSSGEGRERIGGQLRAASSHAALDRERPRDVS